MRESAADKDSRIEQLTSKIEQLERELAESECNTKLWQDNCEMLLSVLEPSSRIASPKVTQRDPLMTTPVIPGRSNITSTTRSRRDTTTTTTTIQQKTHTQSQKPREISPIRRVEDDSHICEVLFADEDMTTPLKV